MDKLNNTHCKLLSEISVYHFCTVTHFHMITGLSVNYIRECLSDLKRKKYVHTFIVVVTHKVRAEAFHYLSKKGADFLTTYKGVMPDSLHIPIGTVKVSGDYFHRYHYTTFCILFRQYAEKNGVQIDFMHSYFSKSGSAKARNLQAATQIPLYQKGKGYYVPDGVIRTANNLFIVEVYNDHSLTRIVNSLSTSSIAISNSTPGLTFGVAANPKVLAVFTHTMTMKHVVQKLQHTEGFTANMASLFFFASLEELQVGNIGNAFSTIHGTQLLIT